MLCSQVCYMCDQERSCLYDMGIYFARYQIRIIVRNYMSKCERVVKAFIRASAGVKHRNAFFRKKLSNKYVIIEKKISDIFNVENSCWIHVYTFDETVSLIWNHTGE